MKKTVCAVLAFVLITSVLSLSVPAYDSAPAVYLVAGDEKEPALDYLEGIEEYPARTKIAFVFDGITDYDVIELTLTYSADVLDFDVPYSYSPWAVNFPYADLSQPGVVKYTLRSGQEDDLSDKAGAADLISVNVLSDADPVFVLTGAVKYKNGDTAELKTVTGGEKSAGRIYVYDAPLFIGAWRGEGDLTGNITGTGREVFRSVPGAEDASLMRADVVDVGLPDDAYSFADTDEAVIILKENYLKERGNGYNGFKVTFNDIQVDVTYFVMKEKTAGDWHFNARPYRDGNAAVILSGIPATHPCLLDGVKLDGEELADRSGLRLTTWCGVITLNIAPESVPRDSQPHEFTLTFENLDSVSVTVWPYRLGDVNGDSDVDAGDARLALRASAGLERLSDASFMSADIDDNGKITAAEARTILRVGAELEEF